MKTVLLDEVIEIIDLAREGEIDNDLRSIKHRIERLTDQSDDYRKQVDKRITDIKNRLEPTNPD